MYNCILWPTGKLDAGAAKDYGGNVLGSYVVCC